MCFVVLFERKRKEVFCMKILVADDEDVFRRILIDFLANEGFDIVEAVNGREALLISQSRDEDRKSVV